MSAETLQHLKSDLKTIRQAAGIDFPFNRAHIPIKYTYAVSGLVAATWAWLAADVATPLLAAVFIFLAIVPALIHTAIKAMGSETDLEKLRQPGKHGYSWMKKQFLSFAITMILAVTTGTWLVDTHALNFKEYWLVISIFVGMTSFVIAVYDRNSRAYLPFGIAFITMALLWLLTSIQFLILAGLCWSIAHILEAAMWRLRLRQLDQWE